MAVIKANLAPPSLATFSMTDIESQARATLARAREQGEKLLADARAESQIIRKQARTDGYAQGRDDGYKAGREEGLASGREQALAEQRKDLSAVLSAFTAAVAEIDAHRRELATEALRDVIELAIAIAERVTKRQGQLDREVAIANVEEALKLVIHSADVRIVINPKQIAVVERVLPRLKLQWPTLKHIELVPDESISPGGCRVCTAQGQIDAGIEGQLQRIAADLVPDRQEEA